MTIALHVPSPDVLSGLPVEVRNGDEPWITVVTGASADDGQVAVTWDVMAQSVALRWEVAGETVVSIERERATQVLAEETSGGFRFHIEFESADLRGTLTVDVGNRVRISDALIRF